jgi:hypothetical protein
VRPLGSRSFAVTLAAVSGPLLVTVSVYVTLPFRSGDAVFTDFVIARFASFAFTSTLAALLPDTVSVLVEVTAAEFVTTVWVVIFAVIWSDVEAPFASEPIVHTPVAEK